VNEEEEGLKNYIVTLSIPVEARSVVGAVETFLDESRAVGWVFRVRGADGDVLVDTEIVEGRLVETSLIPYHEV
jgi:hypothetical protein